MKKGIHYWALPKELSLRGKMRFAKELGFNGIELVILEEGELRLDSTDLELRAIKLAAKKEAIEIIALSNSSNWKSSLTSDIKKVRDQAKGLLIRQIEIASSLDVEVIVALPGFVNMNFITDELHPSKLTHIEGIYHPGQEIVHYETAYQRSLDAFKEISSFAKEMDVTICIENVWNQFLLSPLEMRDFIDRIGSDYVKIFFDIGNVYPLGYPEQWIRILGSRIKRVHAKDFIKGNLSLKGFVNLLSGDVNYIEVIKALNEIGYDGWVTAEVNVNPQFPEFTARSTATALDLILNL